jgi:hypothetical protein
MPDHKRLIILDSLKKQVYNQIRAAHANGFFHLDLKWQHPHSRKKGYLHAHMDGWIAYEASNYVI